VRSLEISCCPVCEGDLTVIGSRRRKYINQKATRPITLVIRRMRCTHCGRIHHELPDILLPYKRYASSVVEKCISNRSDSFPCEEITLRRWKCWFFFLEQYLEACMSALRMIHAHNQHIHREISTLHPLKNRSTHPAGWLRSLVRIIANSNRWPHTRSAS